MLSKEHIQQYIKENGSLSSLALHIKKITNSTNDDVRDLLKVNKNQKIAVLAEQQNQGRGRNNKKWVSPFGKNIYLSFGWSSSMKVSQLEGLSLAVGVSVYRMLIKIGLTSVKLKWPNDILIDGKKLGGILIETISSHDQASKIIIGIGLNINMEEAEGNRIDQDWTTLRKEFKKEVDRNEIAGLLLNELIILTKIFTESGLKSYIKDFNLVNFLNNKECTVSLTDEQRIIGVAEKVNEKGELILKSHDKTYTLRNGEVTIRPTK